MSDPLPDVDFPDAPYPGARPDCSFVHVDAVSHPLRGSPGSPDGWAVGDVGLDDWLGARGEPALAGRAAVLTYGSNACPSKITWMRRELGLAGPVVVLRVRTVGLAAVWCARPRLRDPQLPAVLVAMAGRVETHGLWLATPAQLAVLDACEGAGDRYRLVELAPGTVRYEDGTPVPRPLGYVAASPVRAPLLHRGRYLPVADVAQSEAQRLLAAGAGPGDWRQYALPIT